MQESSKQVVLRILSELMPKTILDAPSGDGWLRKRLPYAAITDGIDFFETSKENYRAMFNVDLDAGIPAHLPKYDAVVCCEGLEHFGNPLLFLQTAGERLEAGGLILVTTPNVWYPASRLQFLTRGFFPSFPCLVGKMVRGTHMHIMPWSFPQLYLYLKLAGYVDIQLHAEPLSKPKHLWERLLAQPQRLYCQGRLKKARTDEETNFWRQTGSGPSIYGRHLIVTARLAVKNAGS